MKILILCKKFPYPLKEGEPIAIHNLCKSLFDLGCEITLLVLNTSKHYFDPKNLPEDENFYSAIHCVEVDNRITAIGAAKSLLSGKSYLLSRFEALRFRKKLSKILMENEFDIVQIETIYMAHYIEDIREFSNAKIAIRTHNVEHLIWDRVASLSKNPLKRIYLKYENSFLKKFEVERLNLCDLIVSITKPDLDYFQEIGIDSPNTVAPVGIDLNSYKPQFDCFEGDASIAFIGALDWMPNQYGIIWFIEQVWPSLASKFPKLTLHVAGKNTPEWIKRKQENRLIIHGEVPDAKAFINQHPIFIAPLFSGSGIKIKILEGLALGRIVVTTDIGAEGIDAKNGKEILLANNKVQFELKITKAIFSLSSFKSIGINGRAFIIKEFDNLEIADKVLKAFTSL